MTIFESLIISKMKRKILRSAVVHYQVQQFRLFIASNAGGLQGIVPIATNVITITQAMET